MYSKTRKADVVSNIGFSIRTKGMGEIFHGQTKGYMFACDQLHTDNISRIHLYWQVVCMVFHNIVKIDSCSLLPLHIHGIKTMYGGNWYVRKDEIRNPHPLDPDQLLHQYPRPHAPGSNLYHITDPLSLTPPLHPFPWKPQSLQGVQIDEIRDGPLVLTAKND